MAKYALCIGINDYSLWASPTWKNPNLPCSLQCAEDFKDILIDAFGYPEANVRVMRDSWATRGNILQGIADLLKVAGVGDSVCVFISGHGARVQGVAANGTPEPDKAYEGILPYAGSLITDFDINALVEPLDFGAVNLTFVLDSCHSGGMSPVEGAPQPVGAPYVPAAFEKCRQIVPFGISLALDVVGVACVVTVATGMAVSNEEDHFVDMAKSTLISASAFNQFGWQVPAIKSSIFVGAMKNVINQSNFQMRYFDFLDAVRQEAGSLMTKHVNSIPTYADQRSLPQLYGQRARMQENVLAPFTFSVVG